MNIRLTTLFLLLFFFTGCAGKSGNDLRVSLGFTSAYKAAQTEFHQGLIMESRERLLGIKKDDEEYTDAQVFLKQKVEPARLKLLRYYARKGKAEEAKKEWAKAEESYRMAVELSQQPEALIRYEKAMNLKARQLRLDSLYVQRKKEDQAWSDWQNNYTPPQGLMGDDESFVLARQNLDESLEERLSLTKKTANFYEKNDMPELAWLYADSYLRLSPGDKKSQDLKNAMATAVPKGFVLPREAKKAEQVKIVKADEKEVTGKEVKALIKKGKWSEAKQKALVLRQQGNPDADKLLKQIDTETSELAEAAYQNGNLAFRSEKINGAVKFWQRAVDLKPDEQTYVDSLRRGKQIQERLDALKTKDK